MLREFCVNHPRPRKYHGREPPPEVSSAGYPRSARPGERLQRGRGRLKSKMLDRELTVHLEYLNQMWKYDQRLLSSRLRGHEGARP